MVDESMTIMGFHTTENGLLMQLQQYYFILTVQEWFQKHQEQLCWLKIISLS